MNIPLLQRLGSWVAALEAEAISQEDLDAAKRSILDTVGVAIAGAGVPAPAMARRYARSQYAPGAARLFGADGGLAPAGAAFVNAVTAHALDFDDTCYVGIAHGSAVVLPAVLAVGQAFGADGRSLITGFLAGVEIEYALGRAFGDRLYFRGVWTTGALGTIGAAAGSARMLGLTADQTAHAIAIAACQVAGLRACFGTLAKPILAGRAAEAGVAAALLAGAGVDGPPDIFEGANGWAGVVNQEYFDSDSLAKLGSPFVQTRPGVAFKTYPVCSAAQSAVEAVLDLMREHTLTGMDIAHVRCEVTPMVEMCLLYADPTTPTEAQFSMPFAVGCALAYGAIRPEMLSAAFLANPALRDEMKKVVMVCDRAMADNPDTMRDCPEAARVHILTKSGQTLSRYVPVALGMPSRPIPVATLLTKFRACTAPRLGAEDAEGLLTVILSLETTADLAALAPSLPAR